MMNCGLAWRWMNLTEGARSTACAPQLGQRYLRVRCCVDVTNEAMRVLVYSESDVSDSKATTLSEGLCIEGPHYYSVEL